MNQLALILDAKAAVLNALSRHIGAGAGMTARELAALADITEREVRHQVSALREEGVAVCGHPRTGYYIASSAEELGETCEYLKQRALHSLRLVSLLEKKPLAELLGQLKVNA